MTATLALPLRCNNSNAVSSKPAEMQFSSVYSKACQCYLASSQCTTDVPELYLSTHTSQRHKTF